MSDARIAMEQPRNALEAERTRLTAARETADRIVAQVGDWDGGESPRLMVAVIDPETNTRMATAFVTVRPTA